MPLRGVAVSSTYGYDELPVGRYGMASIGEQVEEPEVEVDVKVGGHSMPSLDDMLAQVKKDISNEILVERFKDEE